MKKIRRLGIIFGVAVLGGSVFVLTRQLSDNFLAARSKSEGQSVCSKLGQHHTVTITADKTDPVRTIANACDTLTIVNNDGKMRDIAFGVHDKHIVYDGISLKTLVKGQSFTVTLGQKGTYLFHDHRQEEVGGGFTVR